MATRQALGSGVGSVVSLTILGFFLQESREVSHCPRQCSASTVQELIGFSLC